MVILVIVKNMLVDKYVILKQTVILVIVKNMLVDQWRILLELATTVWVFDKH